ncbi:MAG: NAD(P)/FAD-dependent oxidoreductase [Bacteroidia bacterium]
MIKEISLTLLPHQATDENELKKIICNNAGISQNELFGFTYLKQSFDARKQPIKLNLTLKLFIGEPIIPENLDFDFKQVNHSPEVAIIGAGPAGYFAALKCLELGLKPIVFERGKDVKDRRRDLANITKHNTVNPNSNYCFGEGGAGTYSDGKLYTRSSKRGNVNRILKLLVKHGANDNILYQSHPHIGTNKLPQIIAGIRQTILHFGGEIHFNAQVTDITHQNQKITGLSVGSTNYKFNRIILATGHSARDIFELLYKNHITIEAKPFALGVRVEHHQDLIDSIQYKCPVRPDYLPAASYSLVEQVMGKGVFSFCMCPGGIIAPAMTAPGEIVVNGWSPSKRNNPFANSGIVVSVEPKDYKLFEKFGPLAAMAFQQQVEQACFNLGDKSLKAPAQRLVDFVNNKNSQSIPENSYLPGTVSRNLNEILPDFISLRLKEGFKAFGKKLKGYLTNDAVVLATESRTSSPVRIPRNKESFEHIQIKGLYPCGEGAGYAGGIVSAAMDGENCAIAVAESLKGQIV